MYPSYTRAPTHTRAHPHKHARTHTYTRAPIHTRAHPHIHASTHTYTRAPTHTELTAVLDDLFIDFLVPVLVTRLFSRSANSTTREIVTQL